MAAGAQAPEPPSMAVEDITQNCPRRQEKAGFVSVNMWRPTHLACPQEGPTSCYSPRVQTGRDGDSDGQKGRCSRWTAELTALLPWVTAYSQEYLTCVSMSSCSAGEVVPVTEGPHERWRVDTRGVSKNCA